MSKVSIIIVAYNCSKVIHYCILSCIDNTDAEIIMVDNNSSDSTLEELKDFNDKITIIKNKTNKGFTYACNQGIKAAQGKYIFLLNPDAWLANDSLSVLVNKLEMNPKIGAIAPMLVFPDGSHQNYTRTFPTVLGLWVESFVPMRWWNQFKAYKKYTCQNIDFSVEQEVEQPAGAALLFRKQWLLDESYFIYGSDVDLCKCIIEDGYHILQTPDAKVYHYQSKGGTENHNIRLYLDIDNYFGMQYYYRKHHLRGSLIAYSLVFSISLLLRAIIHTLAPRKETSAAWLKLKYFIQNKNFTAFFKQ